MVLELGRIPKFDHQRDVRETANIAAPTNATYVVNTGDSDLSNEQVLASLSTGIMKVTNGTGTISVATADTDYLLNISGDTTPELGGELDCGANTIGFTQQTATGDGTTTIDWTSGNKFKFTFGAQNETFTFTAPTNPCNLVLLMVQDSTGSRTATWPSEVKWPSGTAPTLSTGASAVDMIAFYYDGTSYHGVASLNFS